VVSQKYELNEFLQDIKINEKGRVEIEELNLVYGGLSGPLYVPSLFEKILRLDCFHNELTSLSELPDGLEKLDCFDNQLTSLPKLPDGLKELNCSHNQLTSLPKLPDGLKKFYCYNNPFSQKTIERIKSHPNYDDGIWEI
jgi:Leucine-rich repeat (LRR) protein